MGKWREFKLKTRALYKKIMLPVGSFIGKLGLMPNVITIISGVFAIATAVMYALQGHLVSFNYWWVLVTNILPVGAICMFSFAGIVFASYARARGESVAPITVESVGIMERREKLILLYLGNILYIWWEVALIFAIAVVGLLSFITTIQRMFYIRKALKSVEENNQTTTTKEEGKETIKKQDKGK